MISNKATRLSQPIGTSEIDYSNPLAFGLIQAVNGSQTRYSVGGFQLQRPVKVATTLGIADATSFGQMYLATPEIGPSNSSFTFLIIEIVSSSTNISTGASVYKLGHLVNASGTFISSANGTTAGAISASLYLGGTRVLGGSFVKPVGSMYTGVLRHRHGVDTCLFVDGVEDPAKLTLTNTSLGFSYFGPRLVPVGAANVLAVVWKRALSNDEIAAVSRNPWQLFKPAHRRIYFDMGAGGGTSPVSSDQSASYAIRGEVSSDHAASYAIRSSVNADLSASYNIQTAIAVSSDLSSGYEIRTSAQSDAAAAYIIRASVQADSSAAYAIRSSVQADAGAAFFVRDAVLSDASASYVVRTNAIADLSAAYEIQTASGVVASLDASYNVRAAVQSDASAAYDLRTAVWASSEHAFMVRGLVSSDLDASYTVEASLVPVYADLQAAYLVDGGAVFIPSQFVASVPAGVFSARAPAGEYSATVPAGIFKASI